MKKVFYGFVGALFLLVIVGCGTTGKTNKLTCTLTKDDTANGYKLESTYNISAKDNIVQKVDTKEVVVSDNATILSTFETQLNSTYKHMSETYNGYDYSITNDGKQVISDVHIDYTTLDLVKLASDDKEIKQQLMNNENKITLSKIKKLYTSMGANCK